MVDVLDQMIIDAHHYKTYFAHALSDVECAKRERWLQRARAYEAEQQAKRKQLNKYPSLKD